MSEKRIVFLDRPGTRIFLSPIEKSDLSFFAHSMSDEYIASFLLGHNPTSEEDEQRWFEGLSKKNENDR